MKKKEFQEIEKYLNGELTGVDLQDFLNRMKDDEKLLASVEAYKASMIVLNELKKEELKQKLQIWDKEAGSEKNVSTPKKGQIFSLKNNRMLFGIAASLLLIVTMGAMLFIYIPQSASSTFAQFHSAVVLAPDRSISNVETNQLTQLESLHLNGDFISLINSGLTMEFDDKKAEISRRLMVANAYYQLGNHSEAQAFYFYIMQMEGIDQWYQNEAEWRSLMINLESSPFSKKLHHELLGIAENPDHLYSNKAQELVEASEKGVFRWAKIFGIFR